ncbi:MAG: hypothetical protein JWR20_189 [Marmoricola sp.]|nr:hypothetical protein [Marmoricola sp.]
MSPTLVGPGLREALQREGILQATSVPGVYQRSHVFESVVRGLEQLEHRVGERAGSYEPLLHLPPIMPRDTFVKTDYLRSFPDMIGSVETFGGNDRDHARLLQMVDAGEDWTQALEASEVTLSSAACHSVYPQLDPAIPATGRHLEVVGYCFRHEPSEDPVRMQSFRQHEFIHVGTPDSALAHRDQWADLGMEMLSGLGLPMEKVVANDPFFGRAGRMLVKNQRETELKYELVCPVTSEERPTAICSTNYHLEHFGHPFGLTTPDGATAHSACVGFGLERITLALLAVHGTSPADWPSSVREQLWP